MGKGCIMLMLVLVSLVSSVIAQTCASPPATPSDRRTNKSQLRVAQFNLAWLFDGVNDPSFSQWFNDPAGATNHIAKVAQVWCSM
jgi:hypothetical protein